jgi:hypothetical protein
MSWTLFKVNVLREMVSGRFSKDTDAFADFYANEYDQCIKRTGGDMLYGVNVINGNVKGMSDVIKAAMKKGQESEDENFNILEEIYPSAFDAYWLGAEMSPLPNPILKPLGWPSTPPAPGTIQNIGPSPISLAASAAKNKAEVKALKLLEDELKKQIVTLPAVEPLPPITIPVYETALKILNNKAVAPNIKNHPVVKAAVDILKKLKEAKKKKPSIGSQIKKSIKFPFPKLPKKRKLIEAARDKLIDEAVKQLEEIIIKPIEEVILVPIYAAVETAVMIADSIPNPKPTKEQIKKYVNDTIEGVVPEIALPGISIPKIPTKKELKEMIKEKVPTKEELKAMAYDLIRSKIPQIPNIWFIPPTLVFSPPTNILLDPFVTLAKFHLMGTSGTMSVMAQYPPPAPPAPAILNWTGYRVVG